MNKVKAYSTRIVHSTALKLVLLAFVIYNANMRSITSFDTNATRYLPISIIKEFDLDLDEFSFLISLPEGSAANINDTPYWVQEVGGHYLSTFPIMPAILSVPVYVVPVLLGLTDGSAAAIGYSQTEVVGTLLSKLSASAAVAISVGFTFLTLCRLTSKRTALWIALLYAFATSSWALASQGLWQTSFSQPLLAISLYFLVVAREEHTERNLVFAGLAIALSVASRPPNVVFAVVLFAYVLHKYGRSARYFVIFPAITAILLVLYNLYYFGTLLGGYTATGTTGNFGWPRLDNLLGLLISPNRGVLIFSPVLLFAFFGLGITLYRREDLLLSYIAGATILTILFYSTWRFWHGHFSYSYRHLVDILPAMVLFLPAIWERIFTHKWMIALFLILVAFSLSAQIIGTFFYPCDWYATPVSASIDPSRFWDWNDMQIFRCLQSGPVEPDGLKYLRAMIMG